MNRFKKGDRVTALVTPWTGKPSDGTLHGVVVGEPSDDAEYCYGVTFRFSNGSTKTFGMNREELALSK